MWVFPAEILKIAFGGITLAVTLFCINAGLKVRSFGR